MTLCESTPRDVVRPTGETQSRDARRFAFLNGLIGGMRCGVVSTDTEGRLVLLNEHARRILELAQTPVTGTRLWQALPRHPEIVQALLDSFRLSSLPNRAEMELPRTGKSIGFTLSMVRAEDGEPSGAAMFFKDLTPIEHKEEQERLKDRLAALGQMAASMAHEIRNPLAAIDVTCKLLERRLVDQPELPGLVDQDQGRGQAAQRERRLLPALRQARLALSSTPLRADPAARRAHRRGRGATGTARASRSGVVSTAEPTIRS